MVVHPRSMVVHALAVMPNAATQVVSFRCPSLELHLVCALLGSALQGLVRLQPLALHTLWHQLFQGMHAPASWTLLAINSLVMTNVLRERQRMS
eukprot:11191420-Lingulodinium_polyedra.AAC.1